MAANHFNTIVDKYVLHMLKSTNRFIWMQQFLAFHFADHKYNEWIGQSRWCAEH